PALPYLPFRRISLPSLPPSQSIQHSPLRRQITQPLQPQRSSIASFESVPATGERESRESSSMARNHLVLKNRDSTVFSNSNSNSPNVTPRKALPLDDPLLMKRRKVMLEFYETEKTYVEGLDLIYEHFLLPMLNSLETSSPILERPLLTTVFSNFIDIWNFHRSFFNELTRLFCGLEQRLADSPFPNAHSNQTQVLPDIPVFPSFPPPLSPLLLTHFPYLSLYTPFIAAFSQTLAALNTLLTPSHYYRQQSRTELRYNKRFADFVATQETHPRCGKLQLRDWLLTIVQRCPRYLLLLGDLLSCTPGEAQLPSEDGKERANSHTRLISNVYLVTNSLNTSIWSHSQTLVLLALQRSTPNLPLDEFQFIYPGRTLLKRGTLLQIENPDARVKRGESKDGDMRPREREFLLFSDCLVWLASEETEKKEKEWNFDLGSIWSSFSGGNGNGTPVKNADVGRPKSAALPTPTPLIVEEEIDINDRRGRKDSTSSPRSAGYGGMDHEQWLYKGRIELVNLEIVVDTSFSVEDELEESSNDGFDEFKWRWEVLSPEGSFVLYAASGQDRAEWTTLIRQAKSQHLISLHAQHPDSTLTSSEATKHIRRALQALPFAPNDIRMQGYQERRSKVEHWIPAIWIPDEKAEGCMRCGRAFGWRRRRHHCRLCGRCVCSSCSDKTFYITDPNSKDESTFSKAARACNACYESVFPLIDPHSDPEEEADESTVRARSYPPPLPHSSASEPTSSSFLPSSTSGLTKGKELSGPEALMAIDSKRYSYGLDGRRKTSDMGSRLSRDSGVVFDLDSSVDDITLEDVVQPARSGSRIKLRSQSSSGSRPRSYYDLVEDFHSASGGETPQAQIRTQTTAPLEDMAESDEDAIARLAYADGEESSALSSSSVNSSRRHTTTINLSTSSSSVSLSISPPTSPGALNVKGKRLLSGTLIAERREDTVRRHKRFSIPAVALQTTSVVARTQNVKRHTGSKLGSLLPGMPGTRSKRFSLVSGGRPQTASSSSRRIGQNEGHKKQEGTDLGMGVAASKLNELLGRSKHKAPGG
ncbi:hypothetical protein DFH05DRAFT_1402751, partial [Lentinula detonsa]